jgi:hypothetical protein
MSINSHILTCYKCRRSILLVRRNRVHFVKQEGWIFSIGNGTCPKCKRDNPDKFYWVKRDIDECSSSVSTHLGGAVNYFGESSAKQRFGL